MGFRQTVGIKTLNAIGLRVIERPWPRVVGIDRLCGHCMSRRRLNEGIRSTRIRNMRQGRVLISERGKCRKKLEGFHLQYGPESGSRMDRGTEEHGERAGRPKTPSVLRPTR